MSRPSLLCLLALSCAIPFALTTESRADDAAPDDQKVLHNVFFTLKEGTPENRAKLVAACQTLAGIDGIEYFAVGTKAEDIEEPPSVRDFDVSLSIVFKNKRALAAYITADVHVKFVEGNRATFAGVKVYDTYLK